MRNLLRASAFALLLALLASPAAAQTIGCAASGGTGCTSLIPDFALPPLRSTVTMPANVCGALPLTNLGVYVDITHDWVGDLTIRLESPTTATTLLDQPGAGPGSPGGDPGDDIRATFIGGLPPLAPGSGIPAISGLLGPVGSFAGFTAAAGAWTLEVRDNNNSGTGALNDWALILTCGDVRVTAATTQLHAYESPITNGAITVTRSIVGAFPLAVNVTLGGTAGAGTDYQPITIPVIIPANQASVVVPITPIPDAIEDPAETVTLTIGLGAGYQPGTPSSAFVFIWDYEGQERIPALGPAGLAGLIALIAVAGLMLARKQS